MIDLFGMSKGTPEAPGPAEPRKPQAGSHGLWLSLLLLDSVFVCIFGGAVALKVYQFWKTPALVVAPPVHHRPVPKTPDAVKPPEPAPAPKPVAAPEPPKPAAKPEPRISARHADSPRPPKPSLINEPPKPRSTPAPATTTSAPPAAAAGKAQPVVFKLHSANAGAVQLVGAFIVHGGRKDMTKASDGTWSVKLYLNPGQYRYFFSVDKKKTLDPENPDSDRGASLLTVP